MVQVGGAVFGRLQRTVANSTDGRIGVRTKWLFVFLRFVGQGTVSGAKSRQGFFAMAYELRDQDHLEGDLRAGIEEILAWYRSNLAIPSKFSRSSSKGYFRRKTTPGLSWFKPTATLHLEKARELKGLLESNGYTIEILKTTRPGYILYEDDHQIVAQPFADDRWFE
jgi:hypothetical protein